MKTLNLILPDWAYNRALELAKNHGVTDQAYVSTMVVEQLSFDKAEIVLKQAPKPLKPQANSATFPSKISEAFTAAPDCLKQVLMVAAHVYENGDVSTDSIQCNKMYRVAVRKVANELGIRETTVRDKCSTDRRLGPADVPINQATFINWLCNPTELREHLCKRFPEFKEEIRKQFKEWLPDLPGPFGA